MNGNKYLLDTNAIIYLLNGNKKILDLLKNAQWVGISIISYLEFLSFSKLTQNDIILFKEFLSRVETINIQDSNETLLEKSIQIRKQYNIKLPDAIIVATAYNENALLISNDLWLKKIIDVKIINI